MAAILLPRQGILRNPSPSASPYSSPASLPGTPHLVPSYSSLSSSASSHSQSDSDNYFSAPASQPSTPSHRSTFPELDHNLQQRPTTPPVHPKSRHGSMSQSVPSSNRRIRFAPLPDPRREVLVTDEGKELPFNALNNPVFFEDSEHTTTPLAHQQQHIITLTNSLGIDTANASVSSASSGSTNLLFANTANGIQVIGTSPPTSRAASINENTGASIHTINSGNSTTTVTLNTDPNSHERTSGEWTVVTPNATSSQLPGQSESSAGEEYPAKEKHSHRWTKGLFSLLSGSSRKGSISDENYCRSGSKDSSNAEDSDDDRALSRTSSRRSITSISRKRTDSKASTRSRPSSAHGYRSRSKDDKPAHNQLTRVTSRVDSAPPSKFGVPLGRSQSDTFAIHKLVPTSSISSNKSKRKLSTSALLFSSPTATSLFSSKSKETPLSRSTSLNTGYGSGLGGGLAPSGGVKMGPGGVRRGQLKMLNGRVYGARRVAPFANVRDEEPEFVEWGYGGMGSVNNSSQGADIWSKLQSANTTISGGPRSRPSSLAQTPTGSGESAQSGYIASAGSGRGGAEEDGDGSGMAWVRRRKKERDEKEAKEKKEREEKEAKEKAEREALEAEKMNDKPEVEEEAVLTEEPKSDSEPPATSTPTIESAEPGHITTAVTLPAPSPHHHHSHHAHGHTHSHHMNPHKRTISSSSIRSHQSHLSHISHRTIVPTPERRGSADTARGVPLSATSVGSPSGISREVEVDEDVVVLDDEPVKVSATSHDDQDREQDEQDEQEQEQPSPSSESVSSSASSVLDGSGESEDTEGAMVSSSVTEEDEEDEDDFAVDEAMRKTALGAGVEKISRHTDKAPSLSRAASVAGTPSSAAAATTPTPTPTGGTASTVDETS